MPKSNLKALFSDNPEILAILDGKEKQKKVVEPVKKQGIRIETKNGQQIITGPQGDKGDKGDIPEKGVDYFTPKEIESFVKASTPQKGEDYFTQDEVSQFKREITPIKGVDYYEGKDGKDGIQGLKGERGDRGPVGIGMPGKDGSPDDAQAIADKVNTLEGEIEYKVLKNTPDIESVLKELKRGGKYQLEMQDVKGMPLNMSDMRWHGGGISNITGLITAGSNVTITGAGTSTSPYSIASTGGGGSGTVTSIATGTGLTGGTITSTGTIALDSKLSPADSLTGNSLKFLRVNAGETAVEYATPSGAGDVVGPSSATDNAISRFDTTTGKLIQNSAITISDIVVNQVTLGTGAIAGAGTRLIVSPGSSTSGNAAGGELTLFTGTGNGSGKGGLLTIDSGNGGATGDGGDVQIFCGSGGGGDTNGGTVYIFGGSKSGAGADGNLILGNPGYVHIQNSSSIEAIFDAESLSASNKTFTFPNLSGTFALTSQLTSGTVTSVSGTTNRITSTGGTTPVIDISASYVGQSSITTLGTIGTGVWQGTLVSSTFGGTGVNNGGRTLTLNTNSGTIAFGAASKTLTINKSLTLDGTDSTTMTFPSTTATIARTDAAQTFTGIQTIPQILSVDNAVAAVANAATVTRSNKNNVVTNSSASGLTITLSTTGATAGDVLLVQSLPSSAVAQTITWVNTENSDVTPSANLNASTTSPRTDGFKWNSLTSKWRCLASA